MIFTWPILPIIIVFLIAIGVMIGAVSVGGVVMVPALVLLTGIKIHVVVASVTFSALFSGALGTYLYGRQGAVRWSMGLWLGIGAMVGAYLGSAVLIRLPGVAVEAIVAILVLATGIHAVFGRASEARQRSSLAPSAMLLIGFAAAFGSAVSGAGGPLLLVPILMWIKVPILTAVGLGQLFQIPVALFATARNWQSGIVDFEFGLLIGCCLMLGVFFGARLSSAINAAAVRRIVALVLIGTAIVMFARMAL